MKRTLKLNKTKVIVGLTLLGAISVSDAQWAVTNVNDPLYFGPTGIFTQMTGQMQNTVKASVDQMSAMTDLFRKQQNQLQEDTDVRNRAAQGYQAMAQHNLQLMPTLEACAALTSRGQGAAAVSSSLSGGSGGGSSTGPKGAIDVTKIVNASNQEASMLNTKASLGTCGANDKGVANCSGTPGDYGGNAKQLSADVSSLSIKTNMKNSDRLNKDSQDFANFTLDPRGFDVAKQYIRNASFYNAPIAMNSDQLAKNPGYKSGYDAVMIKLNGAYQAMLDIASSRKAAAALPGDSLAGKAWTNAKSQYQSLFGMKAPDQPSLTELLNYTTFNDYFGAPSATAKDQQALLQEIDDRMALNNLIANRQLNQQENTNILLSLMLTQMTTPVDTKALQTQFNSTAALQK